MCVQHQKEASVAEPGSGGSRRGGGHLEVLVREGGRVQSLHDENLLGTLSRGVMHRSVL